MTSRTERRAARRTPTQAADHDLAVRTAGLGRSFGDSHAVVDVDLRIARGSVVGLLGPNGSGKSTLIRMLSTLLRPSTGRAWVDGFDTRSQAADVRRSIGLTGQFAAVDEFLSGRENLHLMARLAGMSRADTMARAVELLASFDLLDAADRPLATYSGGMRRRLDLALSLTARPDIVFLDEPTTGLDPRSRFAMWDVIRQLAADGTTVLLSTQYLEEADRLAERVIILDKGRVAAEGTPGELRAQVGVVIVEVTVKDTADIERALGVLRPIATGPINRSTGDARLGVPVGESDRLADVVRVLDTASVSFGDLAIHEPTLDDVFLAVTARVTDRVEGTTP
jgi:ABC-2 type transport system ATP-binding protein